MALKQDRSEGTGLGSVCKLGYRGKERVSGQLLALFMAWGDPEVWVKSLSADEVQDACGTYDGGWNSGGSFLCLFLCFCSEASDSTLLLSSPLPQQEPRWGHGP